MQKSSLTQIIAMRAKLVVTVVVTVLVVLGGAATPSYATFVGCQVPEATPFNFAAVCGWDQKAAGNSGNLGLPNWNVKFTDSVGLGGLTATNLSISAQHVASPHGELLPPGKTVNGGSIPAGSRGAGAFVVPHRNLVTDVDHLDRYRYRAVPIPGPDNIMTVQMLGQHRDGVPPPFGWSFIPPAQPGKLEVTESFANGTVNKPVTSGTVKTGQVVSVGPLPKKLTGNEERVSGTLSQGATDYSIRYTVGDPFFSDTTLAFVGQIPVEDQPPLFVEEDLALMADFFSEGQEFLVPALFEEESMVDPTGPNTQDLYIAVDLVQWLSFFSPFTPNPGPISISNGTSIDLLPGFLIAMANVDGSSPITFDPNVGFTVPDDRLFNGHVVIGGTIDGHTVPEPSTVALLGIGSVGLIGYTWRRRKVTHAALQK